MAGCGSELRNVCFTSAGLCAIAVSSFALPAWFNPVIAYVCVWLTIVAIMLIALGIQLNRKRKLAIRLLCLWAAVLVISPFFIFIVSKLSASDESLGRACAFIPLSVYSVAILWRCRKKDCQEEFRL